VPKIAEERVLLMCQCHASWCIKIYTRKFGLIGYFLLK